MDEKKRQKEILKKKREEDKAARAEERRERQATIVAKRSRQPAQKVQSKKAKIDVSASTSSIITVESSANRATVRRTGLKGKEKGSRSSEEEIDTNECAVCFRTYDDDIELETGADWIECACGRWVHENCVDYGIVVDAMGRERICPHCAM